MPKEFRGQTYSSIKKACLAKGELFEDPEFPASSKSLCYSRVDTEIQWARPKELCKVPKLVVDGATSDDLQTGELNNGWFITACIGLAAEPKLWNKVVPDAKTQEWDEKNQYAGIFKFSFWRFGDWMDVVVDDRLPVKDGKLVYCHSKSKNEFWSALLEKAYAKLYGDYETLTTGAAADALVDFSGGVSEKLDMTSPTYQESIPRRSLFNKLREASENKALITCHIKADPTLIGTDGPSGLLKGIGYNVTMVKEVEVKKSLVGAVGAQTLTLLRLFSTGSSWTGAWSDSSAEMKKVSKSEWEKMGVKFSKEGEFWMSYDDFMTSFTNVDICHSVNTSFFSLKKSWNESVLFSCWSDAGRNGGNDSKSSTFLSNPQFRFDILNDSDTIMISVEQRDVTDGRIAVGHKMNTIGFYIAKVEQNRMFRMHLLSETMYQSDFMKSRNAFVTTTLERGRYVIIPCCADVGAKGEFMLRVYTSGNPAATELTRECPTSGCCSNFRQVTSIEVTKCDGLALPEGDKGVLNPYVIIKCEGEKVTSQSQKNTGSPEFKVQGIFYRKKPQQDVIVEVMNRNRVFDSYLCEARIDWSGGEEGVAKVYNLYGRKKEADVLKPGNVHVFIRSSNDLSML